MPRSGYDRTGTGAGILGSEPETEFDNDTPRAGTPLGQHADSQEDKDTTPKAPKVPKQRHSQPNLDIVHARLTEILEKANVGDAKRETRSETHSAQVCNTWNSHTTRQMAHGLRANP